jgi:nitric oxide reductase NorQ protein
MEVSAKVFPANVDRFRRNADRVCGIGKAMDGQVYIEYLSSGNRAILSGRIEHDSITAVHACMANAKDFAQKGCWHMGALAVALGLDVQKGQVYPAVVQYPEEPEPVPIVDITQEILDRPGKFEILIPMEFEPDEIPDLEPPEMDPDDEWLLNLGIPPFILTKLVAFRNRQREILTEEDWEMIPRQVPFISQGNIVPRAITAFLLGENGQDWQGILLQGRRGVAKTMLTAYLAEIFLLPWHSIPAGEGMNSETLLGSKTLDVVSHPALNPVDMGRLHIAAQNAGIEIQSILNSCQTYSQKIVFDPGLLLKPLMNPAGALIVLEEVNFFPWEVTALLHPALDGSKNLSVPGYGNLNIPNNVRVAATMNPGYLGTRPLNEAFSDRFCPFLMEPLPLEKMAGMLEEQSGASSTACKKLAEIFRALYQRVENGEVSDEVLSIRRLIRAAIAHRETGWPLRDCLQWQFSDLTDSYLRQICLDAIQVHLG